MNNRTLHLALANFQPNSWRYRLFQAFTTFRTEKGLKKPTEGLQLLMSIYVECEQEEKHLAKHSNVNGEVITFTANQFYNVINSRINNPVTDNTVVKNCGVLPLTSN
ncbi:hypothetical protein HUO09_17675 [Vibrio sp. Y2-5]|uniref:hypothetical protein n=1 Tax=Vibrio sp. Y2-5 TaxID=2743977 RepID=UPI001660C238|nr:hypothetical protein [Vibrio sp. Y2-5]MBD0788188.1 hypothetical protein [Vibrio sp. Y2-5]